MSRDQISRVGALALVGVASLFAHSVSWQATHRLHLALELLSVLLACWAATAAYRASAFGDGVIKSLGIGFAGVLCLELMHLGLTIPGVHGSLPNSVANIVPWSWLPGRLLSGIALAVAAQALSSREGKASQFDEPLAGLLVICLLSLTLFSAAGLQMPGAHDNLGPLIRPQELLAAPPYAWAAWVILRRRVDERPEGTFLLVAALCGFVCQVLLMPFSRTLYDAAFNWAHLAKLLGAGCVILTIHRRGKLFAAGKLGIKSPANGSERQTAQRFLVALYQRAIGVVCLLALLVAFVFVVEQRYQEDLHSSGEVVNRAGLQRMLDARLEASLERVSKEEASPADLESAQADLQRFEENFRYLTAREEPKGGEQGPQSYREAYRQSLQTSGVDVENHLMRVHAFLEAMAEGGEEARAPPSLQSDALDRAVHEVQGLVEFKLADLEKVRSFLLALTEGVLAFFALFVLVPLGRQVRERLLLFEERATEAGGQAKRIFDSSLDMMCVAGLDGYFKQVNPAFESTLGYSAEELVKSPFSEFIHPEDKEKTAQAVLRLGEGDDVVDFENRYRHIDGSYRVLSWRASPDPKTGEIFAIARDVTQTRRLQERLDEKVAELERSNRELDQFAYVASHDLKAPLRDIDNLSNWVRDDCMALIPEDSQRHLETLGSRVRRMEALLDDVLEYSRTGRAYYESEALSTGKVVEEVIQQCGRPPGFDVRVTCEEARVFLPKVPFQQVVRNLVNNAIKHHDKERGVIEVRVEVREAGLRLSVSDDGPGIPPEFHEQIFEMFRTLKSRDQVEGSGIGLALVKKWTDSLGGTLDLKSAPGQGTTFDIFWPCETASESNGDE